MGKYTTSNHALTNMGRRRVMLPSTSLVTFFFFFLLQCCDLKKTGEDCPASSCGALQNQIKYPFRLKTDPRNCGDPQYELACESNQTILFIHSNRYYVQEISYDKKVVRIVDPGLRIDNCSSFPHHSMNDFEYGDPYVFTSKVRTITFVECLVAAGNRSQRMLSTTPCFNPSSSAAYLYAVARKMPVRDLHTSCKVVRKAAATVPKKQRNPANYSDVFEWLLTGFQLSWKEPLACRDCFARGYGCSTYPGQYSHLFIGRIGRTPYCVGSCRRAAQSGRCFFEFVWPFIIGLGRIVMPFTVLALIGRTSIGIICLLVFLAYKLLTKNIWMDSTVELFLSNYRYQAPTRYSYSNIKKMTRNFKETLGRGGCGTVFKGKLRHGRQLVAVKVFSRKSKGNGQEFINEVATVGRIHHVNVVRLVGFCSEGSKSALIYEYMPRGSLEKYIYPQGGEGNQLSWEKMHEIALGIARGIEYLHRGCDMKILHFDIKPHNILLDEDFTPKVSDFGLAKYYPTEESIVSVTAARGTVGYIAPELFYKNIGGVSYKSDVYSFGMLLMEMAGRRKNVDAYAKKSSQIYFPLWIYDQLDQGKDMEIEDATDGEKEVAKKMVIVALWCIQMKPADRPSMKKVVEMLEQSVESLSMPPKPFLSSPPRENDEDNAANLDFTESSGSPEQELLSKPCGFKNVKCDYRLSS